jgi:iron-sulfur cluster assembly accessory protein
MSIPLNLPSNDPGLQITTNASLHIRRSLDKAKGDKPIGVRIGVRKAGCSGYEYVLEYAYSKSKTELDYAFLADDITVLVDKEIYLKFLKGGTVMDFKKEGVNEGLHFDNPNVAHQCGCGESFTLVDE